ncbi:MAG: ATP-binding protein [Anaerolineaceae bacterium]|nr:ATP-binding protein [Anaerolineaceae bacterium]MDD4042199.1 ATP-binding protein [Anaerolineaceae bacterium]MDD4577035.1 ATP-binding protein [Anaerolineaceae bacterium]
MRELALHILDIAENSISAGANRIEIMVKQDTRNDELCLSVMDNGKGMDEELLAKVMNPFITSRTTRKVGLGIPLLKQAAEACNGGLTIESEPGKGTRLTAKFQECHIDRMPLGNLADTFLTLLLGTPEVNFVLDYQVNDEVFYFDDSEVKEAIEGMSLTDYRVIEYLTNTIRDGINETKKYAIKQGVDHAHD